METYDVGPQEIAEVAARAHRKATAAPHARFGLDCTADDVLDSPMISEPVTRLAMAGNADGAAAAVLVPTPSATGGSRVTLRAWCGALEGEDVAEPMQAGWDHQERLAAFLVAQLYEQASIGPESFDMVQLSDPSAIAEPLSLEALGFAAPGEGLAVSGGAGGPAINTDGGLVGRGHSLAATGLAMLYELWLQMHGDAGGRQVDGPVRSALLHSHGVGGDNLFVVAK
jgi:acetyl-CoA acetyltransferase